MLNSLYALFAAGRNSYRLTIYMYVPFAGRV